MYRWEDMFGIRCDAKNWYAKSDRNVFVGDIFGLKLFVLSMMLVNEVGGGEDRSITDSSLQLYILFI